VYLCGALKPVSGVGRILVWRGPRTEVPKAQRGDKIFDFLNLGMAHFDAYLRYSDVLILKFYIAM